MKNNFLPTEHQIQNSIVDYLQTIGWLCWRNNSGLISVGVGNKRRMIKMGMAGLPDLFAVKANYPLLGIEVKRPKAKTTPGQDYMLNALREHGVTTLIAHSISEVETFIKTL